MEWVNLKRLRSDKADEKHQQQITARKEYYKKLQVITDSDREPYMQKAKDILAGKAKGGA